jgi:hypothetical protein
LDGHNIIIGINESAIKVFGPVDPWRRQERLKLDIEGKEMLNSIPNITVAPFGPFYGYSIAGNLDFDQDPLSGNTLSKVITIFI